MMLFFHIRDTNTKDNPPEKGVCLRFSSMWKPHPIESFGGIQMPFSKNRGYLEDHPS